MMKAIVSLSGGMDSTTVLAAAIEQNGAEQVKGVIFKYGSKHNPFENWAAFAIADHYRIPIRFFDLSSVMGGFDSDLLSSGGKLPEGHYEEESMRRTVVPGRNSIFATILMGLAESEQAESVYLGIHAGDHFIYPDCRPEWLTALNELAKAATLGKVSFVAPFLYEDKKGILRYGLERKVPYQLSRTCYSDQEVACGKCGSCVERREAFMLVGAVDPIEYQYTGPLPEKGLVRKD